MIVDVTRAGTGDAVMSAAREVDEVKDAGVEDAIS
jgi:hypothetical protein